MQERDNIYFIEDDNIKVLFTKRNLDAKNSEDIANICQEYNLNFKNLVFNTQVHGSDVRIIKSSEDIRKNGFEADGLVTHLTEVPLLIFTADCVPLVFYDKVTKTVALAHAGWRGTFSNIAGEIIGIMMKKYKCEEKNIKVILGPSISCENYEVSYELIQKFSDLRIKEYYKQKAEKYFLNLWAINKELLLRSGILEKNIKISNFCTVRDNDKFFSYRLDNQTKKRIGTLIQID
ncbi:peptidoglycan editing factor PgeF [Gemella cuniculi]|uniref:peptidoglycan editing factor PgeF n=1 Tax=Gemella cuniculi TaxID=150240 RepID=UPI000404361E|nr:peptidoglycan editing factor PgeF [Gemella cuniculi]